MSAPEELEATFEKSNVVKIVGDLDDTTRRIDMSAAAELLKLPNYKDEMCEVMNIAVFVLFDVEATERETWKGDFFSADRSFLKSCRHSTGIPFHESEGDAEVGYTFFRCGGEPGKRGVVSSTIHSEGLIKVAVGFAKLRQDTGRTQVQNGRTEKTTRGTGHSPQGTGPGQMTGQRMFKVHQIRFHLLYHFKYVRCFKRFQTRWVQRRTGWRPKSDRTKPAVGTAAQRHQNRHGGLTMDLLELRTLGTGTGPLKVQLGYLRCGRVDRVMNMTILLIP